MKKNNICEDTSQYGTYAPEYEKILVPKLFDCPGRDLLAMVGFPRDGRILDVGTGTGVILDHCAEFGSHSDLAIGIDPNLSMLSIARSKGHLNLVAALVPGLPFPNNTFHTVIGNFILSHVDSVDESLSDMVRVIQPEGKLAVSSWCTPDSAYRDVWLETVEEFIDGEFLRKEVCKAAPSEEALEDIGTLEQALRKAGLSAIQTRVATYYKSETAAEFIEIRSAMIASRIIITHLGIKNW